MGSFDLFAILLGTIIKIALAYILLATFCVFITEGVSSIFNLRGKMLKKGLEGVAGKEMVEQIYKQPFIKVLGTNPPYIRPIHFAKALIQVINEGEIKSLPLLKDSVSREKSSANNRQGTLRLVAEQIVKEKRSMSEIIDELSKLFLDIAGSIASRYKRNTQAIIIVSATVLTLSLNIDTIRMFQYMYNSSVAENILATLKDNKVDIVQSKINILREMKDRMPVGWNASTFREAISTINLETVFGWLITIITATGGASLIFQYLSRHVNLRDAKRPTVTV